MSWWSKLVFISGAVLILGSVESVESFSWEWWSRIIGIALIVSLLPDKEKKP